MAEIKVDYMNFHNINMSSPNSCNSSKSNLNQNKSNLNAKPNDQNGNQKHQPNPENQTNQTNQANQPNNNELNDKPLDKINSMHFNCDDYNDPFFKSDRISSKFDNFNNPNPYSDTDNKQSTSHQEPSINIKPNGLDSSDKADNLKYSNNNFVNQEDIGQLLKAFQEKASKSSEMKAKDEKIQLICLNLFNYDYETKDLLVINNVESELSGSYPGKIIVPKANTFSMDCERLKNLFSKAKFARCRCRFPVPVILFNNKYICRSATLSHCIEIYSRQGYANFFRTGEDEQIQDIASEIKELNLDSLENLESPNFDVIDSQLAKRLSNNKPTDKENYNNKSIGYFLGFKNDYSHTVNEARTHDITLLDYLNVKHIIDLMVEMKKVKYGVYVASSEKADKLKRYRDFNINVLPYPGCEFFKSYRDNNYQAEGLVYNWDQAFVDANLSIPKNKITNELKINFNDYKDWDLNDLTSNYLKLILSYLVEPNNESILLHCISGWDRTPQYVSLVRLSLWADYELHPNLNYEQILYLTLAYDWYLFGHDLNDRVEKGEVIMHYCFYFLKFLSSTEHSIDYLRKDVVKKGKKYVRVRYNCCGQCKKEESRESQESNNDNKKLDNNNKIDESKLSVLDLEDEISSSMYSSQASTVVNNNLKKEQLLNNINSSGTDSDSLCSSGNQTPKDSNLLNSCFLVEEDEKSADDKHPESKSPLKEETLDKREDVVDHPDLATSTMSTKTFVVDQNISPSLFSTFKDLRNNSITSLNRNSLTIESTDINKFDVISLDDQSLSSNSSYDVLHAANKQQQVVSFNNQQLTPTNQPIFHHPISHLLPHQIPNEIHTNGLISSSPNQPSPLNNLKHQPFQPQKTTPIKHNNSACDLIRRDSFSCGSPPKLVANVCDFAYDDQRLKSKLIEDDQDDTMSNASCESSTLAEEDTIDSGTTATNANIQRSNAVAIPRNGRQNNKFNSSSISSNDHLNWSNEYSNNSNLSNASNRLSDQSFNLNRCDSWQIVTDTGSIRKENFLSSSSLDEIKRNMNLKLNNNNSNANLNQQSSVNCRFKSTNSHYVPTCCCKSLNCGKHCEKVEKYNKEHDLEGRIYTRQKRLSDVRVVFYQCYSKYIGLTPNGASGNELTSKFHNLFNKTSNIIRYPFRTGNGFTRNGSTRLSSRKSSNQFQSYIEDDQSIDLDDEN